MTMRALRDYLFPVVCLALLAACDDPSAPQRLSQPVEVTPGPGPIPIDPRSPSPEACLAEKQALLGEMTATVSRHQAGCASDADCAVVAVRLPCQEGCGQAVAARDVERFQTELSALGRLRCRTAARSCGIEPMCAPLKGARCLEGICRPNVIGLADPR
jgi:hypothetical protein